MGDLRVRQGALGLEEIRARLIVLRLSEFGVDAADDLSLLDRLVVVDGEFDDLAGDLATDLDGGKGLDGPAGLDGHRERAGLDRRDGDLIVAAAAVRGYVDGGTAGHDGYGGHNDPSAHGNDSSARRGQLTFL